MCVFNPRILDASIRDVTACLSDTQKADVLLHALQHLPSQGYASFHHSSTYYICTSCTPQRSRIIMEKLLNLLFVLSSDPANQDVEAIIQSEHLRREMEPAGPPRFSSEVWREIALNLPKRDLKSLLLVPHALSRIASQLIFREIDLHFTASPGPPRGDNKYKDAHGDHDEQAELDAWHYQRSADILTRILVDPVFASHIRSLSVYAITGSCSFFNATMSQSLLGMLINSLPKLSNLRSVHCSGNRELINRMLETILSLNPVNRSGDIDIPPFKHITHFSITAAGGNGTSINDFISQSHNNLRSLVIKNISWKFPSDIISVRHLTILEFEGRFSADSLVFSEILSTGYQLESLTLSGILECTPSAMFRLHRTSLPFLTHFTFKIVGVHQHITDRDLGSQTSSFFHLIVPSADHHCVGFDASAWGVLPSLINLRSLCITFPSDLSPSLAGWLIPRSIMAQPVEDLRFINFLGMTNFPIRSIINIIDRSFSKLRLIRIDESVWSVIHLDDGSLDIDQWPYRRTKYYTAAWLESLECEEALQHLV
ncbi:hypothetical protein BDR07DRAFT_1414029 [Suillus spraguei]|nr:hypothetical protein BDR07DRAFT_1414029 [Suillus spraguei]